MTIVIDYKAGQFTTSDNDNLTSTSRLTRDIIGVKYHALGVESLQYETQVATLAKEALTVLHALGVDKLKLAILLELIFSGKPKDIEESYADLNIANMSLASLLAIDLRQATRQRLQQIIANPQKFSKPILDVI